VQVFSTMSLEITRHGFSPSIYGLVISLNGVLIVLCELPLTVFTKRYPARQMMALGFTLIGMGFASNVLMRTLPLLALTVALFTLGEMIAMPISGAYVADLAPAHQRGLYMGTYGMVWSVAFICGPSLGMWLFSVSPLALWSGCGLLGLLAAGIILRDHPGTRRGAQPAEGGMCAQDDPEQLQVQRGRSGGCFAAACGAQSVTIDSSSATVSDRVRVKH
jgi:MFS family permease